MLLKSFATLPAAQEERERKRRNTEIEQADLSRYFVKCKVLADFVDNKYIGWLILSQASLKQVSMLVVLTSRSLQILSKS